METQLIVLKGAMIVAIIVSAIGMQQHIAQAFPEQQERIVKQEVLPR